MVRPEKLIALLTAFVLSSCSQQISFSFEVSSPTPVPSLTPFLAPTEPVFPIPTPFVPNPFFTPTPTPVIWPRDFSPVLYGGKIYDSTFFLLLGGVNTNLWLAPEMSVARYEGEATYSLHSMTQEYKYFLWGKSPAYSPTCPGYFVGTDAGLEAGGGTG